jgi:hypothetical protein
MTGRQIFEKLKNMPEDKLDLPVIVTHGSSGETFEVNVYGEVETVTGNEEAGVILDMEPGDEYIWGSL